MSDIRDGIDVSNTVTVNYHDLGEGLACDDSDKQAMFLFGFAHQLSIWNYTDADHQLDYIARAYDGYGEESKAQVHDILVRLCRFLEVESDTQEKTDTATTTIYGASDDLIEFEGAIDGECHPSNGGDDSTVILTAPDGATLTLTIGFCTRNPDGWSIAVESHGDQTPSWPIRFVPAPGPNEEGDPGIEITHPAGTTATYDGEEVR